MYFLKYLNKISKNKNLKYIIVNVVEFMYVFKGFLNYLTKKSTFKLLEMLNNLSR